MNDTDKVTMTINIGSEHLQLSVAFNQQNVVRDAEKAAADLFKSWRSRWPSRSDNEILAMIAYQFAFYYKELAARFDQAAQLAADASQKLDDILALDRQD